MTDLLWQDFGEAFRAVVRAELEAALAPLRRAQSVVREQRDPEGEYAGLNAEPESIVEALALQELRRLQAAVMGE